MSSNPGPSRAKWTPSPLSEANNIYLYDYDGNRYADMSSLHVNMNLGYGNQEINNAIRTKLDRYAFTVRPMRILTVRSWQSSLSA